MHRSLTPVYQIQRTLRDPTRLHAQIAIADR